MATLDARRTHRRPLVHCKYDAVQLHEVLFAVGDGTLNAEMYGISAASGGVQRK